MDFFLSVMDFFLCVMVYTVRSNMSAYNRLIESTMMQCHVKTV